MALTRNFRETILAKVQADTKFSDELLRDGVESMLSGDVDAGKSLLRDYIKATIGFERLGAETKSSPKSLIRMFGPGGNPQARNLFTIVAHLQRRAQVTLHVTVQRNGSG